MGFSQPVLVIEKENKLFPHKIRSLEQSDFEKFSEYGSIFSWCNSFLVPLETRPYDLGDFEKVCQDKSPHLACSLDMFRITAGKVKPEDIQNMYQFLKSLFYHAPQSDAIGYRQRNYEEESTLILYHPQLVENFKENERGDTSLVKLDFKNFSFQVNLYVPNGTPRKKLETSEIIEEL